MPSLPRAAMTVSTLLAFTACSAGSRTDAAVVEAALHARSDSLQAAESAKNRDLAITFWAPDAIIQGAGSPQVEGREKISALYKVYFEGIGLKSMEGKPTHITVSQSGDLAYEIGVNRFTFSSPKGDLLDVGKYLLVWKKTNGIWYVAALSFTSDAAAPVPVAPAAK